MEWLRKINVAVPNLGKWNVGHKPYTTEWHRFACLHDSVFIVNKNNNFG